MLFVSNPVECTFIVLSREAYDKGDTSEIGKLIIIIFY